MNNQILILDDEKRLRDENVRLLKELLEGHPELKVGGIDQEEFNQGLMVLKERQSQARNGSGFNFDTPCCFDKAAVLIVENDLVLLHANVTGEYVAYMARCFSGCGFILGVNQFGPNSFDLTLVGHPESFADLNVGIRQLADPGLWTEKWNTFRPWHWPLLPSAYKALEKRTRDLAGRLGEPILEFLQIPQEVSQLFPREVIEFIAPKHSLEDFHAVTFEEFLASQHGLQPKDGKGNLPEDVRCRIAASRIAKWLERLLLAGQELLIDAPHLVRRMPSLLGSGRPELADFNNTARIAPVQTIGLQGRELIEQFEFRGLDWLSRPAWFWEQVRQFPDILEVRDPWARPTVPWEFCEDCSQFKLREECREFEAKAPAADSRRWVQKEPFPGVDYVPAVQFTL